MADHRGRECFRFLLLGKTGSGKSTSGNTIFGERQFDTAATFSSVTADCQMKISDKHGRRLEIVDSPGLYDTHKTQEETCVNIVQAVAGMHPGPHAILYVVRLGRYTHEEHGAYTRLKILFDEDITKHMIVLFTFGDMLEREGMTVRQMLEEDPRTPQQLKTVLEECGNRYIVFNNMAEETEHRQVEQLLSMVRRLVSQNGGRAYSCPTYSQIGENMEKKVARRLQEAERRDLKRHRYVQQLERQTHEAEETAQRTKEQIQKNEAERQRRLDEERRKRQELEDRLQAHAKEQEESCRRHQEELDRFHRDRQEQEKRMKQQEQRMSEVERKRAADEAERTRQREEDMRKTLRHEQERLEEQRRKDKETREAMERQRREFEKQMEERRRRDREELRQREEKRDALRQQRREEERAAARKREEDFEREMEELKRQIVEKEDSGFIEAVATIVAVAARVAILIIFKV